MEESRLDSVLEQLQIELDAIQDERRWAYNIALGMNSTYVIDRKFCTTFVRAESYDAKKAAIRMLHFLTYAREKFGDDALLRPIRWDAMAILEEGSKSSRDNAGRLILSLIADAGTGCPLVDRKTRSFLLASGKESRTRSRFHIGTVTECMYSLKGYGIPVNHLPPNIDISTNDRIMNHLKWCAMRQAKDRLMEENPEALEKIVEIPHHEDYLFGKGQAIMKHQGNIALRALLKECLSCWENAAFKEKSSICWEVIHEVAQQGGRFLRETPQGWFVEVEPESVRQKVSIAFRDMLKRARRNSRGGKDQEKAQAAGVSSVDTHLSFPITLDHAIQAQTFNDLNLSGEIPQKRRKVRTGEDDEFSEKMCCSNLAASNHRKISRDSLIFPVLSVLPVVYLLYYLGYVAFKNFCGHQHPPMVALISLTIAQMVQLAVLLSTQPQPEEKLPQFDVELDDNDSPCSDHQDEESIEIGRNAFVTSEIV
ncbi:hypothetical protein IV203_034186 [Nitzschia inconspicua]|uniref:DUF6824 domain-containing protein n=1 Tax=Nitzschia inconspicua TaxID=303405 RepID=A0A9K3M432_9STRA|nr:hypothetical protein IV203_034186 [Nitzschia inconspicua]